MHSGLLPHPISADPTHEISQCSPVDFGLCFFSPGSFNTEILFTFSLLGVSQNFWSTSSDLSYFPEVLQNYLLFLNQFCQDNGILRLIENKWLLSAYQLDSEVHDYLK